MDFSSNDVVDPFLVSISESSLAPYDFDLSLGTCWPERSSYHTIEPSRLGADLDAVSPITPSSITPLTSPDSSPPPSLASPTRSAHTTSSRARRLKNVDLPVSNKGHIGKRHQTKLACTWCRRLSKKCDARRPCARCVRFNRCSECVDASPRRSRAKGLDRGTYKKTRDLAVANYQEAVNRRQAYVTKQAKAGRVLRVGLSPEELLEKVRSDEDRMRRESRRISMGKFQENESPVQDRSVPFTGPLEDLFTCSASPEIETPSPPSSTGSVFDISSATNSPIIQLVEFDESVWYWQSIVQFPNVMDLVAAARTAESPANIELPPGLES